MVRRRQAEFWGRLLLFRRHFPIVVLAAHAHFSHNHVCGQGKYLNMYLIFLDNSEVPDVC